MQAGLEACSAMRARRRAAKGLRAPFAAVDAIEAELELFLRRRLGPRAELFAECVVSDRVARRCAHLFFAEREVAKVPDVPKDTPT